MKTFILLAALLSVPVFGEEKPALPKLGDTVKLKIREAQLKIAEAQLAAQAAQKQFEEAKTALTNAVQEAKQACKGDINSDLECVQAPAEQKSK